VQDHAFIHFLGDDDPDDPYILESFNKGIVAQFVKFVKLLDLLSLPPVP